jgi:hypothetical protein
MKPALPPKDWTLPGRVNVGAFGLAALEPQAAFTSIAAFPSIHPLPLRVRPQPAFEAGGRRLKIWQLGASLHCSIIGTCLTTGELRTLVRKFKATSSETPSDHELHSLAVAAATGQDQLSKQIQKALDRRHGTVIRRFAAAASVAELLRSWDEARRSGDIPGAYWAVLTHPLADEVIVRRAFGDVHMLSHLVGAANRADIRRLHQLEEEKAALEDKLARQQAQLRDGILARDAKIRDLGQMLAAHIESEAATAPAAAGASSEGETLNALIVDLRKQLDAETRRRERAERRASELSAAHEEACCTHRAMERDLAALREEVEAVEAELASLTPDRDEEPDRLDLDGMTILYVGGRPHLVARLKSVIERAAGQFIHYDGGIEERRDLLPGLVGRADAALFPVDCVSHNAAQVLKRLCRQAQKPLVPLRSASIASLVQGLRPLALNRPA